MSREEIRCLKRNIDYLKYVAEQEHEGSIYDLSNILQRVIHNFEHKGQRYIVERYWQKKKNSEGINISRKEIVEVLQSYLEDDGHKPTAKEISKFIDCIERDKSQWLSDNAKWFLENEMPKNE